MRGEMNVENDGLFVILWLKMSEVCVGMMGNER